MRATALTMLTFLTTFAVQLPATTIESKVEHGYVESAAGVKIHYAAVGPKTGPVIVMVHGFPDFWFSWRAQMEALSAAGYRCVALDLRGYNLSDKPKGIENYDMRLLVGDVAAVIQAQGRGKAILMAHDWGGAIAWQVAFHVPQVVEKLIIINLPHPKGLSRELANNPAQQKNSQYARNFQQPDSHTKITAEGLAFWVSDPEAKKKYIEAFSRSDFEAMMNYYRRNYPREPYTESQGPLIKPQCPVLMIHGLKDTALLPGALNGTWEWVDDFTLVTIPEAGHFAQQDAPAVVNRTVKMWLARDK
ncbi:MAG: alpha/beta hydrolase [Bryobacteraceae bacterium]|nr:alpha/beta hydrolase [Bryobacteraceae bacterium]